MLLLRFICNAILCGKAFPWGQEGHPVLSTDLNASSFIKMVAVKKVFSKMVAVKKNPHWFSMYPFRTVGAKLM